MDQKLLKAYNWKDWQGLSLICQNIRKYYEKNYVQFDIFFFQI